MPGGRIQSEEATIPAAVAANARASFRSAGFSVALNRQGRENNELGTMDQSRGPLMRIGLWAGTGLCMRTALRPSRGFPLASASAASSRSGRAPPSRHASVALLMEEPTANSARSIPPATPPSISTTSAPHRPPNCAPASPASLASSSAATTRSTATTGSPSRSSLISTPSRTPAEIPISVDKNQVFHSARCLPPRAPGGARARRQARQGRPKASGRSSSAPPTTAPSTASRSTSTPEQDAALHRPLQRPPQRRPLQPLLPQLRRLLPRGARHLSASRDPSQLHRRHRPHHPQAGRAFAGQVRQEASRSGDVRLRHPPGARKRAAQPSVDGVAESLVKSKKYLLPLAVLSPELTGGVVCLLARAA